MSLGEVGTCRSQGGCIPRALGDSLETLVSTATIVLIIVIVLIVVALIGLAAWMSNKKKMEHRRAEAERIRQEAAAHEGGLQESQIRAREAEVEAEQARLKAQRAEEEAARAHQGVSQERALHEDKLREADRLDPNVDHRAEDYNPDTRATEGALDRLLEVMDERLKLGICGPRLELDNGGFDHAAKRSFPTPLSALGHFTGIGRRRGSGVLAAYRAPEVDAGPVDAINGACMLFRRSGLEEVGLFDEGYWMYMEDLDLCYRFARAGWVTWYEPSVAVTHVKGGSSGRNRSTCLA